MNINHAPMTDPKAELTLILLDLGYAPVTAESQVNELVELIMLCSLQKLAEQKGLDLAQAGPDEKTRAEFVQQHFSAQEMEEVLKVESPRMVEEFLQAVSQKYT